MYSFVVVVAAVFVLILVVGVGMGAWVCVGGGGWGGVRGGYGCVCGGVRAFFQYVKFSNIGNC